MDMTGQFQIRFGGSIIVNLSSFGPLIFSTAPLLNLKFDLYPQNMPFCAATVDSIK